jgi:pyruvate/2-oxoglutarate dehydrogenase complex dihydrolipoamide acyltransferase (E2) component
VLPTVMPGQAAALSAGAVSERPAVIEGEVVAARVVDLVVACDERLAGAEVAGALLSGIGARLADASAL